MQWRRANNYRSLLFVPYFESGPPVNTDYSKFRFHVLSASVALARDQRERVTERKKERKRERERERERGKLRGLKSRLYYRIDFNIYILNINIYIIYIKYKYKLKYIN